MAWRYENNGPPRKMSRKLRKYIIFMGFIGKLIVFVSFKGSAGSVLPPNSQVMYHPFDQYCGPVFRMDPPPPPPILMNCGEIREHHHGICHLLPNKSSVEFIPIELLKHIFLSE